ncbi:hypothetical protein HA48_01450 [Pantoea wallisii]|uniref:Uncharacterized protein n=1 Tax=Pantoea wallisii TaxID=1076551 RepID=A0A1X1DDW2_9GAMM|nr:hypothetical protein HA48_01450 [Pantoea wallisii]
MARLGRGVIIRGQATVCTGFYQVNNTFGRQGEREFSSADWVRRVLRVTLRAAMAQKRARFVFRWDETQAGKSPRTIYRCRMTSGLTSRSLLRFIIIVAMSEHLTRLTFGVATRKAARTEYTFGALAVQRVAAPGAV